MAVVYTNFFGGAFFGGGFFGEGTSSGGGGIDPSGDGQRRIVKPTGLLRLPKKKEGRKDIADRIDDSADIAAEVAQKIAREFAEETAALPVERAPIERMSIAQIEQELEMLMAKQARTEEEEFLFFVLVAAASASKN